MQQEEIRRRAISAQSVLENDAFRAAFNDLRDAYVSRWENSADDDTKNRELYYNKLKAIQEVKREFIKHLDAQRIIEQG